MKTIQCVCMCIAMLGIQSAALAHYIIGSDTFPDHAFDNAIVNASNDLLAKSDLATLNYWLRTLTNELILDGTTGAAGIEVGDNSPSSFLKIEFSNTSVVNGPGNDIAIYEAGSPETFGVVINGISRWVTTDTELHPWWVGIGYVNLDDFGITQGGVVNSITLTGSIDPSEGTCHPDLIAVGSFYVPEPATLLLLGLGGMTLIRRQKRKNKAK